MTTRRRFLATLGTAAAASALWVPSLSTLFGPSHGTSTGDPDDPVIRGLVERQLRLWEPGADRVPYELMRFVNPEWDLMGRTFAGLALLEVVLAKPELEARIRPAVDRIVSTTLERLSERGKHFFLMGYGRTGRFLNPSTGSVFIDGELLTLVAARETVFTDGRFQQEQQRLAERVRANMDHGPQGHGESYPDECWAVCNAFAAVGLQLDQRTSGRDHRVALERYREGRRKLVQASTGMLHSEYTYVGRPLDGPEGSSIYLTAALLENVAPGEGQEQYALGRHHLLRRFLGFGYSREWAAGVESVADVDSGPIVPIFQASSAASGLALIGSRRFGDTEITEALLASMWAAAFPTWDGDQLYFAASNPVGDASILYGLVQGRLGLGENS